ncbi:MAG: hypothetical protein K2R98_32065 [Gemmataceae bacterium]|nr:hypothetical protein [Gemmataceae bacterium]
MLGIGWMSLLEQIPVEQHDALGVMTTGGTMINVQSLMRMEEQYIVVRGRLVGTTDAGRTFFVPYDQIDCLFFQRFLREEEVQAWFGGLPVDRAARTLPTQSAEPTPAAASDPATPTAPGATPAPSLPLPAAAQGITTRSGAVPLPGKAAILERLRRRTPGSQPGTTPKPNDK